MRFGVEQPTHIGHHRRPVEQLQKERVVIEDVKDACALFTQGARHTGVRHTGVRRPGPLPGASPCDHLSQRGVEAGDLIRRQKIFEDEIPVVVEKETLGLGGRSAAAGGLVSSFIAGVLFLPNQ